MATRMAPAARREQILAVAREVFAESGFRNVSLRGIAARCGMSAPGLMHHFPDIESLLTAVLEARDAEDVAAMAAATPATGDIVELLRAGAAYYADRGEELGRFRILEGEAVDPDHPAHRYFAGRFERTRLRMRTLLEERFANAEELSYLVTAALEGLRHRWDWDPDGVDIGAEFSRIAPLLLAGAVPREDL